MTTFSDNLKKQYLDIVKTDTSLSKLSKFNLKEIKSKNSVIIKNLSNKDTINFNNFALPRLNDNQYNSLNTIEAPNAKKLQDLNLQDNFFSKIEKNNESLYNKKRRKVYSQIYIILV